jgi:hypothetical protein
VLAMNPGQSFQNVFENKNIQFKTPEEEVAFLREQLKQKEGEMRMGGIEVKKKISPKI